MEGRNPDDYEMPKVKKRLTIWGVPKIRGTILGVLTTRIIIYWGQYWGPPILGNYHIPLPKESKSCGSAAISNSLPRRPVVAMPWSDPAAPERQKILSIADAKGLIQG